MCNLLSDITLSHALKYEAHSLIYTPADEDPIVLTGFLGAAVLAALLVDTPEGEERGVAVDTPEQREQFFLRYDREVRRDDWGYLEAEVRQLRDSYVQFVVGKTRLSDICPNARLFSLAVELLTGYMHRLVIEQFCEHIWEYCGWETPFAQWLWNAAHAETRRQRYLHADWTDMAMVTALADFPDESAGIELPTFFFEGEKASDIMDRYLQWLNDTYVAIRYEQPGAKITSADRNRIFKQETDWSVLSDETEGIAPSLQKEWKQWMTEWEKFLTDRLQPAKEVQFWANDVPENVQEHLLYHLKLVEQHPARFRDLTAAVYAMRQLGYIRRKLSDSAIRLWLSEHLSLDYTARNNASQFQRAMKEHGRYTPEVRDEVQELESMGFFRFQAPSEE